MKQIFILITFSLFISAVYAQKKMMLDAYLKVNSESMLAKAKGISVLLKYEFGPYKIASAKGGMIKSKSNAKFFSAVESTSAKQKYSFVFLAHETDTVAVNVSIQNDMKEVRQNVISISKNRVAYEREIDPSAMESTQNTVASITLPGDTTSWVLIYYTRFNSDSSWKTKKQGSLTDGTTMIELREVRKWEDGSSPKMYTTTGFEFYLDGSAAGAVQNPLDTFQKKYVWLRNNLDEKMKTLLAAASAVLLNFSEYQLETQ